MKATRNIAPNPDYTIVPADDAELARIIGLVAKQFPNLLINEPIVMAVHARSRSILSIKRGEDLIGCLATLFLNDTGLCRLLSGAFPMDNPPLEYLSLAGESTAAIYVWMFLAPSGAGAAAMGNIMKWFQENGHAAADIYGRPLSMALMRLHARYGSYPISAGLWVHRHDAQNESAGSANNIPLA